MAQNRFTAVGRRDADGGRATHHHGDNDVGYLFIGGGEHIALLEGELGLIDKTDAFGGPGQGGYHAVIIVNVEQP